MFLGGGLSQVNAELEMEKSHGELQEAICARVQTGHSYVKLMATRATWAGCTETVPKGLSSSSLKRLHPCEMVHAAVVMG